MYKLTTLDNGLKVATNRMTDVHSLSVGLWIKTGGRYETLKNQGISHFVEHMLFKGTKKRSCQQLKQAIEEKGGAFNAFTSEECVCYYTKILSRHIALATDVLSDMVLDSSYLHREIEKERKVIFEEARMYLDLPMQYVHDLLDEILWPNHPLGMSLLGTKDSIATIKQADFLKQRQTFHAPNNIIAVACGDIEHGAFLKEVEKFFKKQKPRKIPHFKKAQAADPSLRTNFYNKNTEQTHLCLGVRALSRQHPGRYALALLNIILGGNMSSRLFNEIREKRSLAYEIGSSVKQYCDTGSFFIHAGVDNLKVTDAVSIMMKELKKIKKAPVTRKELDMAKEYYRSGLLMSLESTMSNMLFLGEQLSSTGKVIAKESILREIEKVDIDAIHEISDKIFTDNNLKLAMIGPQKTLDKKKIEELLYF